MGARPRGGLPGPDARHPGRPLQARIHRRAGSAGWCYRGQGRVALCVSDCDTRPEAVSSASLLGRYLQALAVDATGMSTVEYGAWVKGDDGRRRFLVTIPEERLRELMKVLLEELGELELVLDRLKKEAEALVRRR